jgi:hypothetical protein
MLWSLSIVFGLWKLIFAFSTLSSTFFLTPCKIPNRWICHTAIMSLGPKFRFKTLEAYFRLFWPSKVYFFWFMWNSRSMDIWNDHPDFGPQIPFLGSGGQYLPFWPPKVYFFMLHVKLPIDGYITRPYWFWAPNSVFGLWLFIFAFLTHKGKYSLHLY